MGFKGVSLRWKSFKLVIVLGNLSTMQQKILKSEQYYAFESHYREEGAPAIIGERLHRPLPAVKNSTQISYPRQNVPTLKPPPGRNFAPIAFFFACCSARWVLYQCEEFWAQWYPFNRRIMNLTSRSFRSKIFTMIALLVQAYQILSLTPALVAFSGKPDNFFL